MNRTKQGGKFFGGAVLFLLLVCLFSLPGQAAPADWADGAYTAEVEMSGGSGRASITSPAPVTVTDGTATAQIEWSSPNYDYMIVDGEEYLPARTEDGSVFEIPVLVWDEPMTVTADTTAMSVPHEIEYTLTFHSDTVKPVRSSPGRGWIAAGLVSVLVLILCGTILLRRRRHREKG